MSFEGLQSEILRQRFNFVLGGIALLADAGGEQYVKIATALQLGQVGVEVVQLIGVINDEQTGLFEVSHGLEQYFQALGVVPKVLKF